MARWIAVLAIACLFAGTAHAQVGRQLPADGKLGELTGSQQTMPVIQIGGVLLRLAPGGLIFDQNNRTILHGQLPERATVLYVQGTDEEVTRIYILSPEELELVKRDRAAR